MRIIPFFTRSLGFFFKKSNFVFNKNNLLIYDRTTLPYSRRFLSKIYFYKRKLSLEDYTLPHSFDIKDKRTILVLNKDYSIASFPVSKINVEGRREITLYSFYNNKIYNYIINITNNNTLLRAGGGEIRISPSLTGAIIFLENEESEEEAIEVSIGMLSIYSPDEIIQKYM